MTRAMDVLCLTYPRKRQVFGAMGNRQQSIFLDDIERRLALFEKQKKRQPPRQAQIQLEMF
ncbi:MAG: hypothetical protein R6V15_03735 [Desulfotignum sp.]